MSQLEEKYKQNTINAWKKGSEDALDAANDLYATKKYVFCLFFCHLSLEKLIKALYLHRTNTIPPYIHDLDKLIIKSGINVNETQLKELLEINTFCIKARYDDIKNELFHKANYNYTTLWLNRTIKYTQWIQTQF